MKSKSGTGATRSCVSMITLALALGCSDSGNERSTNTLEGTPTLSASVDDPPPSGVVSSSGAPPKGASPGTGTVDTPSSMGGGGAAPAATAGGGTGPTDTPSVGGGGAAATATAGAGAEVGGAPTGGSGGDGVEAGGAGGSEGDGTGGATPNGSAGMDGAAGSSAGNMSPGCGSASSLQSGNFTENIDGTMRNYSVYVPNDYDANQPYRLIFVWHPLGGSAGQVVDSGYNGLEPLANDTAIFVAADGLDGSNAEASGRGWWNVNGVDMKLLTSILDNLTTNLCIDQDRIFSTGFSFGGMMSYTVGYQFDVFRAIAPCSGDLQVIPHDENNTEPLPMMAFHGDNDDFVTTARGRAARDQYLMRNNCGTQTQPVDPSPCVEYQDCDVPTFWCEFPGAHTTWSEQPQAIWEFFSTF